MRPLTDADDELVRRAQAGDREAFEELVRRHAERLYRIVAWFLGDRHEAEDVTQEAFVRAWRGLGGFKRDARFFTWLYRIGVNEAHRRASRRLPAGVISSLDEDAVEPDYRAPVILRDIEGLSTAQ